MNKNQIKNLSFKKIGNILRNADDLVFDIDDDAKNDIRTGWVYIWAKSHSHDNDFFEIAYIGKAGGTLLSRCKQHQNGFRNSARGQTLAGNINEYLTGENNTLEVYARKSESIKIFEIDGVSLCEAEECAIIIQCLKSRVEIWNKQLPTNHRELAHTIEQNDFLQIQEDSENITAEAIFFNSIENFPAAQLAITELLLEIENLHQCSIHYTFTNNADIRVRCSDTKHPKGIILARFYWQPKKERFAAELFLDPNELRQMSISAENPNEGAPNNVQSKAYIGLNNFNDISRITIGCIAKYQAINRQ